MKLSDTNTKYIVEIKTVAQNEQTLKKINNLQWWKDNDEEGNSMLSSIGLDQYGEIIAFERWCEKENCSCDGSWYEGNRELVEEWVERPKEAND
ncbi:MAG: hypothetical protein OEX08_01800 [Candidatus Nomurabacteria bacterium]|nr:hypothetical protein [Candidatus Nomurabacteria bacterium]